MHYDSCQGERCCFEGKVETTADIENEDRRKKVDTYLERKEKKRKKIIKYVQVNLKMSQIKNKIK